MVPKDKKRGLGRGLSALMADVNEAEKVAVESVASGVRNVPIEQVKPNPDQPRKRFRMIWMIWLRRLLKRA